MLQNLNDQVVPMNSLLFRLLLPHPQEELMGHRALARAEILRMTQGDLSHCASYASDT